MAWELSTQERQAVVEGAKWMDAKYPGWHTKVLDVYKQGKFDIEDPSLCVIGAGTGHIWTDMESQELLRHVCKALGDPKMSTFGIGLTSSSRYETAWIQEARARVGSKPGVGHLSRLDRILDLTKTGQIDIETVARHLDCPEASIRRDIQVLRKQGYYITLDQKQIFNYGLRGALIPAQED